MTIEQFLSYLVMPVGGLLIGGIVLWMSRREAARFDAKYEASRNRP